MNVLTIVGRLTRDAEQRHTQSGTAVAGFTIASDVGYGDKKKTLFMNCSLWGKRAEGGLLQYLTKGTQVVAHGELQPNDWTDKEGNQRKDMNLNVADVKIVGGKGDSNAPQGSGGTQQPSGQQNSSSGPNPHRDDPFADNPAQSDDGFDSSIPF